MPTDKQLQSEQLEEFRTMTPGADDLQKNCGLVNVAQQTTDSQKHFREWRIFYEQWKRDVKKGSARHAFAKSKKMTQRNSDKMIRYGTPAPTPRPQRAKTLATLPRAAALAKGATKSG
jgi:hypothetical protein